MQAYLSPTGLPVVPRDSSLLPWDFKRLFAATLLTIATASIVYAILHMNLSALAKPGGISGPLFWISIFSGITLAYTTETITLFSIS